MNLDSIWDTFKIHFEQVHPNFYTQLTQRYQNLSQIDLRHCAYLKIGLSNEEIAHLLNISVDSVSRQHHRIEKKMNLAPGKTLNEIVMHVL